MRTCTTHHYACDCREAAHAAEVARLNAEIARVWQPIETAPKDGTRILGHDATGISDAGSPAIILWSMENCLWWDETYDLYTPTHWQPLPAAPDNPDNVNGLQEQPRQQSGNSAATGDGQPHRIPTAEELAAVYALTAPPKPPTMPASAFAIGYHAGMEYAARRLRAAIDAMKEQST